MATMPLSVVMPMHNAARFVEAAIHSVLTQSRRDFIFYIVDDGSTDGSGDIAARIASHDERIHLIRSDNRGIVASLNHMLALVDTPFVARMDMLPTRLGSWASVRRRCIARSSSSD